jgi:hypothetical protein
MPYLIANYLVILNALPTLKCNVYFRIKESEVLVISNTSKNQQFS